MQTARKRNEGPERMKLAMAGNWKISVRREIWCMSHVRESPFKVKVKFY